LKRRSGVSFGNCTVQLRGLKVNPYIVMD